MTLLSYYRDILGRPNQGLHKHVFGIALFDMAATVGVTALISYKFDLSRNETLLAGVSLFTLGIFMHYLFGVNTTVNRLLGISKVEAGVGGVKFA